MPNIQLETQVMCVMAVCLSFILDAWQDFSLSTRLYFLVLPIILPLQQCTFDKHIDKKELFLTPGSL